MAITNTVALRVASLIGTKKVAACLVTAGALRPGLPILLWGQVGAGKTALSREIIRAWMCEPALPVTSPTFLLDNTYKRDGLVLHHYDLYRLRGPEDFGAELGIFEAMSTGSCLIEWPERFGDALPPQRLDVTIEEPADSTRRTHRDISLAGHGADAASIVEQVAACFNRKQKAKSH